MSQDDGNRRRFIGTSAAVILFVAWIVIFFSLGLDGFPFALRLALQIPQPS